jgi:galactoside O-acetyltransferase
VDFYDRMCAGMLYTDQGNRELAAQRLACRRLVREFNLSLPEEEEKRQSLMRELLAEYGQGIFIEPPIYFGYGRHTHIGDHTFINFNLVVLDDIDVFIGRHVMLAPNVMITTTGHPVHPDLRRNGGQFSFPVHIEDHVWIGAGAQIMPGVRIGRNSVIGAGSVVTKDIPADVVAYGSPCRVRRAITERDREYYYHNRRVGD